MELSPLLLIVLAVAAVVVVAVFFFRKKALPPAGARPLDRGAEAKEPRQALEGAPKGELPADGKTTTARAAEEAKPAPEALATSEVTPYESVPAPPPPVVSKKEVAGLRKGLSATRGGFMAKLRALVTGAKEIDASILEQMEEVMLSSDVGVKTTQSILERLRDRVSKHELSDPDALWAALRAEATRILTATSTKAPSKDKPHVVLVVGVNGVGKTTTIGKLSTKWTADGKKVVLAAGDTFRAAAVQQLEVWGKRVGAEVVRGKEGADPGAVAFEATKRAKDENADILLVDTAGRLHTKVNLMDEIKKVKRTIAKAMDGAPHETLLVLDATTGQNALAQATLFKEALELTGIILTKLDGTAKGGVVLAVCDELAVPVRYIGLGERAEDLREFVAADFVEALFGKDEDVEAA